MDENTSAQRFSHESHLFLGQEIICPRPALETEPPRHTRYPLGLLAKQMFPVESGWQLLYPRALHLPTTPGITDWTTQDQQKQKLGGQGKAGCRVLGRIWCPKKTVRRGAPTP